MAPSLAEVEVVLQACSHQVALCCSVSSPAHVGGTGGAGMSQQRGCVRFAPPRRPAERRRWMRAAAFSSAVNHAHFKGTPGC